jgi:hypothetical protein
MKTHPSQIYTSAIIFAVQPIALTNPTLIH